MHLPLVGARNPSAPFARDAKLMHGQPSGRFSMVLVWATTVLMIAAGVAMFVLKVCRFDIFQLSTVHRVVTAGAIAESARSFHNE